MPRPTVILVHGQWMTGLELFLLRRRLAANGYEVHQFRYRMVRKSLEHNTARLAHFIRDHARDVTHLVGHSLGGVLALQTLQHYPDLPVDKVVCIGSPLVDTEAGRRLARFGAGRSILGKTLPAAVFEQPLGEWAGPQAVGVLAGTRGVGIGQLTGSLPRPHDGVITLAETCLPGVTDHLSMPLSHSGLVMSPGAAEQVGNFLEHGRFRHNRSA